MGQKIPVLHHQPTHELSSRRPYNPKTAQGIVEDLAQKCGGHALALTLAAGAVKRATILRKLGEPGTAQWQGVLDELTHKMGSQHPGEYATPLRAYAMSVEQQTEHGKSVLSTLCLFPAVHKAPKEMVRAIWDVQVGPTSPAANQAATFEDGLEALALANIVDVHEAAFGVKGVLQCLGVLLWGFLGVLLCHATIFSFVACISRACNSCLCDGPVCRKACVALVQPNYAGKLIAVHSWHHLFPAIASSILLCGPADVSFHLLLSEYLASMPTPLAPQTLPSTDLKASAAVVLALLSLCSADGRAEAMGILLKQLQEPNAAATLSATATALRSRVRFGEALTAWQQALTIYRSAPGDAHPNTAQSLNDVGCALERLGRHEEALQHQQQALAIRRSALGDAHPDTAQSLNAVGGTLTELGRREEALQHQQQALAIRRSALGDAHPDTAQSLNDVGFALGERGRHEEALQHQQQALTILRFALGDAHPDTAQSLNDVGFSLGELGRHEEALQHQHQALTIRRDALGDAHPDTAQSVGYVGNTLFNLGRHKESLQYAEHALAIYRFALGDAHPLVARSLHNMHAALRQLGRHEEALQHQQQALAILRSALGDTHPHMAIILNDLGDTLRELGRHEEALQYQQQALAIRRSALGDAHPDTVKSLNNVESMLGKLGRHKEAHPNTATSPNNVGGTFGGPGRHEQAPQQDHRRGCCGQGVCCLWAPRTI